MANHKPIFAVGAALLRQLQIESLLQQQVDDDRPNVPDVDPLASAQSRRAVVKAGAGE
jgi:hypothetical protein